MIHLQQMRERRKLTQFELSKLSGVSQQLISMIEKGQRPNPTIETLYPLSEALKCSIYDLYTPDTKAE